MKRIIIFIIIAGIVATVFSFLFSFKPKIDGEVKLKGLIKEVTIIRDTYGVPYIKAQNKKDLFFALGFVNTQDRLWQMDLLRRIANGRMSEILGEKLLNNDIFLRTIGLDEIAEKQMKLLLAEIREVFDAFTLGINAGIEKNWKKTVEFRLLNYKPEPWRIEDSLAIFELLMWQISYNFKFETIISGIAQEIGIKKAQALLPSVKDITYASSEKDFFIDSDMTWLSHAISPWAGASNAWVVSGDKTKSGKTILANDTHLTSVSYPCPFYLLHVVCPEMKVTGMMLPGVPCILTGANDHLAWGVTNMGADVQDLYLEKILDKDTYLYKNKQKSFKTRVVDIRVKNKKKYRVVHHVIKKTGNGPIIKQINENLGVSLRWCDMDGYPGIVSFFNLAGCKDTKEFTQILRLYEGIPFNFLYADIEGNILYHAAGKIPKRSIGYGYFPSKGWEGENEWNEYFSFNVLPYIKNPQKNYIAITNSSKVLPDDIYMPGIYAPDSRTMRIIELLEKKDKLSLEDMKQMPLDERSLLCKKIWNLVKPYLENVGDEYDSFIELLNDWQGDHGKNNSQALLFNAFLKNLIVAVYSDEMNNENVKKYLSHWYYFIDRFVYFLKSKEGDEWFDNKATQHIETKKEIIQQVFKETVDQLKQTYGSNMENWKWGDVHTITFQHFLGKKGLMKKFLNYGPFPYGGGIDTINRASYTIGSSFITGFATCSRMVIDFSDISKIYCVISTGQSANKVSPFSNNLMKLFLDKKYVIIDTEDIYKKKNNYKLILLPN